MGRIREAFRAGGGVAMTWVRLIPSLLLLTVASVSLGQGLVLFPFDASGKDEAEVSFLQKTLAAHLAPGFRLFEGEGVEAALLHCREEAASVTSCLALVGEVFEAGLGARGRWVQADDGDAFFLEVMALDSGRMLFVGRDTHRELSADARLASLVRRARTHVAGGTEPPVWVMPGMAFVRVPGEAEPPVYLQVSEVTQAQWRSVMGYNPSWFIACGDACPVESVTRSEIDAFLARMNTIGRGRFRLPTLVEWQRALARSGPEAPCLSGNNGVDYRGYPCGQWPGAGSECAQCGPRPAAGRGDTLENMIGNVWEWVDEPGAGGGVPGLLVGGGWSDAPAASGLLLRVVPSSRFAADDAGFRLLLEGAPPPVEDTH